MRHRRKLPEKEHGSGPAKTISREEGPPNSIENDKLLGKNLELKHRLCLLEFGLGLIATIFEQNFQSDGAFQLESNGGNPVECDPCEKYKLAIENIGKVLCDMESAFKSATGKKGRRIKSELVAQITPLETGKPRIFIDEMEPGKNSLSGLCNIQIVENSTIVSYSDPSLEALSTLATVAVEATSWQNGDYGVPPKKRRIVTNGMRYSPPWNRMM